MSKVIVASTSDSPEAVAAANADTTVKKEEVVEVKPAPGEKAEGETAAASEATDEEEIQTEESEDESESDEEEQKADAEGKKPKNNLKKRFKKLTNKLSAKDQQIALKTQEAEHWKREALKSQNPATAKEETQKTTTTAVSGKPKAEDFETHEEFLDKLTDWKMEQRDLANETKSKQAKVRTELETTFAAHTTRVETFKEAHDDWDEVMDNVEDVVFPPIMHEIFVNSENGPELMYALAQNRTEAERIAKLPPAIAARELGKFEAKVLRTTESSKETNTSKTTKAPPPPKPVGSNGKGSARKSIDDPNLTQSEYEALRREQSAKNA